MTDTTYNGWTNYATWRVNLELCHDTCAMMAKDVDAGYRERFTTVNELADYLKEWVENVIEEEGNTVSSLAITYAFSFLSDVNWYEIAEHWTDELIAQKEDEHPDTDENVETEYDIFSGTYVAS